MDDLQKKVAICCRMMEWMGLFDFNGHVSARLPNTDYIFINSWGKSRCNLTPEDVIKVDLQGKPAAEGAIPPSETPIHTAIYRVRSDIQAVAHIHSPAIIVLTVANKKVVPVIGLGSIFPLSGVPVYDDSQRINTIERGEAMARTLGQERAVLLRGHGAVVVAETVEALFFASLCLEDNAKKLFAAYQIGQPQVLRTEEIEGGQSVYTARIISKAWSYYRDKAGISF